MQNHMDAPSETRSAKTSWVKVALLLLIFEKIVQHIFVTLAFIFDWGGISASVVVNPDILIVLGAIVAVVFVFAFWGIATGQPWAINLVIALALFDIVSEFVAQGRIAIKIPISFLVALLLLVLALQYRRQALSLAR